MAINEINTTTPVLPPVLPSQTQNVIPPVTVPFTNVNPVQATAAQTLTPVQEAELLINETLLNLNFVPSTPPEALVLFTTDPLLATLEATQGLDATQQVELLLNETLLNLSPIPPPSPDPLLINETNPALETIAAIQNLTITEQAAVLINETFQGLNSTPPVLTPTVAATTPTTATAPLAENLNPALPTAGPAQLTIPATATAPPTETVTTATPATIPTPVTSTTTVAVTEELNPAAQAVPPVDPTNFGVAVYEIRDQTPAPAEPKPIRPDIFPSVPIGRVRPVGRLVLRKEWERRKGGKIQENIQQSAPMAEKSIQQVISQANEELLANGIPLHLVFAKKDKRYLLDIYDCSEDDACRLEQEVPINLKELSTVLDNIQHESGIIIDLIT